MEEIVLNSGDTAWVLASTALVLLMTPGLAFFYGGMVRAKSVLNMMMMSMVTIGIVSILWVIYGFKLAFGYEANSQWYGEISFSGLGSAVNELTILKLSRNLTIPLPAAVNSKSSLEFVVKILLSTMFILSKYTLLVTSNVPVIVRLPVCTVFPVCT